nr:hypothetical protein [Tanacetum cinerariifolium]
MLAPGSYAQWKSRFMRYVDTKPNKELLKKTIFEGPYIMTKITHLETPKDGDRPREPCFTKKETYANTSPKNRFTRNANPLALVAATQNYLDDYYQAPPAPKPYKPHTSSSRQTSLNMSNATTKHKGKKIFKQPSPPSESAFKEDNDEEQAQKDKLIHKSLTLIAKHFKNIYKPTNNNLRTSSNTKNKNVDTSPRTENDKNTRQFGNQRTIAVAGIRETVENQDTDEESDKQELEAHYMYMAKIQEVLHAIDDNIGPTYDVEPLKKVHTDEDYNVFATERQHSEQPESINNTYVVETLDSNFILNSTYMCDNERKDYQNAKEPKEERVSLASLIANLKLDVDDNKKIQKQLKKANTSLTQELDKYKLDLKYFKIELERNKSF